VKILKNIFNSKSKQNTKYEPNTLAEMNGSPDLRLATAKEKEVDIPLPKADEVKKIQKSSSKPAGTKSGKSTTKSTVTTKVVGSNNEMDKKVSDSSTSRQKSKSPAPSTTESKATEKSASRSNTKDPAMKSNTKKASESKSATSSVTKNTAAKTAPAKSAASKEVKNSTKAASTTKKATPTAEKKSTVEKKIVADTTKKATAKKSTATKVENAPAATKSVKTDDKVKKPVTKKEVEFNDDNVITESKATRSGKFEIKKSKDGRFVFNLYASNNVIVATSQIYSSSTSAVNGIKSVIANAATAQIEDQSLKKVTPVPFPKWEIYQDKGAQYRFRLCASNGSCVIHSQGYTSKSNCKKGIESIIKFASDAEITKVYLDKK
jgi:uncharacterized protein YegP (UPF0339 family)